MVIQAFIKNYQEFGVYCSLNIGVSGIIRDEEECRILRQYYDIGDIVMAKVEGRNRRG